MVIKLRLWHLDLIGWVGLVLGWCIFFLWGSSIFLIGLFGCCVVIFSVSGWIKWRNR
jgi:hypothetical protein